MNYPIFDGHCDTAFELYLQGKNLTDSSCHMTLDAMKHLGKMAQFFAFCPICHDPVTEVQALYRQAKNYFMAQMAQFYHHVCLCGNTQQRDEAWKQGKIVAFLSIEGAEAVDCDPGRLEEAERDGIRMVTLTWNYENALGGSHLTGGGLTAQGKEFVRRAQKLGIVVDVSHASEQTFFDVCEIAEKPIVASHSNCRSICRHSRNLTDDQIRCLSQIGGTAGLNLWADSLWENGTPSFDHVRMHLEHLLEVGGDLVPALGGDLDGCDALPAGFSSVENYRDLFTHLEACGFEPRLMEKICVGNLSRVMDVCECRPV